MSSAAARAWTCGTSNNASAQRPRSMGHMLGSRIAPAQGDWDEAWGSRYGAGRRADEGVAWLVVFELRDRFCFSTIAATSASSCFAS